nr:coiled-coil domain-containing protein 50 [Pelodiscus sinensis]|eukprot:XP_025034239.1 coiled-coil domain-containing protein 50 [Pelodiscus sinensis]
MDDQVCRDFAVLEDHTLAHSLQEQEIEHHLATNVQRNRLVQHDLQVAKQLQEEEDRRARTQIQKRHKDIERQDCEIAQEIQVKLVIEAEQRRRQEEKDEDIARILQQKELQEEKKRKKHHPDPPGLPLQEDSYYAENGGTSFRGFFSPRTQEAVYAKPRVAFRDQELTDAEIARKLQEEELLEIARLLMAEEKKAYKKTKEREKSSSEKKRQDQEWRQDPGESARPRSRDRHEPQRPKSDRPARPPPPSVAGVDDFDHTRGFASPPSSVRQFSKPESSPKGFHYKQ